MMLVQSVVRGMISAKYLLLFAALIVSLFTHTNAHAVTVSSQPSSSVATVGQSATFRIYATTTTGGTIYYSWFKDGQRLSAYSRSYTIASVTSASAGTYSCMARDSVSTYVCRSFTLTVNAAQPVQITQQPVNLSLVQGNPASLSVAASGTAPYSYQWYFNGVAISGATFNTLSTSSVSLANAGNYHAVVRNATSSATTRTATVSVSAFQRVSITQQPSSQSLLAGAPLSLSVAASGTATLSYQWYFNGQALSGAVSRTLSMASVTTANSGNYSVVVRNSGSSATSSTASVTVSTFQRVSITQQPVSTSVVEGSAVRLGVTALGTGPLTYQWYFNGQAISGATASALSTASIKRENAGSYNVVVRNSGSSVTSSVATVTVTAAIQPVSITQQPSNQIVNERASVTFGVAATGTGPLSYQWYFNGQVISGATASSYVIASAASANSGNYRVVIRNSGSSATSNTVSLSVLATTRTGSALLQWYRPTTREDGSTLPSLEISGFRIYYSTSSTGSMRLLSTLSAADRSYLVSQLAVGTHYFAMSTVDIDGLESDLSLRRSVTIP